MTTARAVSERLERDTVLVVECSIPDGMTIADWRARRARRSPRHTHGRLALVAALLLAVPLLVALAHPAPGAAASSCVAAEEAHASGDDETSGGQGENEEVDEDAPPRFSRAFYRVQLSLDASLDGFEEEALPVSIEEVCRVPRRLKREAAQLAGTDGVAVVLPATRVVKDHKLLREPKRTDELGGADTAELSVRLLPPTRWREDEDGDPVPTFRARRIALTD